MPSQILSDITGVLDLLGNKNTRTTQSENISPEGMQAMLNSLLGSTSGLAQLSQGANTSGLYNSSTRGLLANDLMSRTAGEIAGRNTSRTVTNSTPGTLNSISPRTAAGTGVALGAAQLLLPLLKKTSPVSETVSGSLPIFDASGSNAAVDVFNSMFQDQPVSTGADAVSSLVSSDPAYTAQAGQALNDLLASGAAPSIWDTVSGWLGFADGGAVPTRTRRALRSVDAGTGLYGGTTPELPRATFTPSSPVAEPTMKVTMEAIKQALPELFQSTGGTGRDNSTAANPYAGFGNIFGQFGAGVGDAMGNDVRGANTAAKVALALIGMGIPGAGVLGQLNTASGLVGGPTLGNALLEQILNTRQAQYMNTGEVTSKLTPTQLEGLRKTTGGAYGYGAGGTGSYSGNTGGFPVGGSNDASSGAGDYPGINSNPGETVTAALGGRLPGKTYGPLDDLAGKVGSRPVSLKGGEYIIPTEIVDRLGVDKFDKLLSLFGMGPGAS
jgi:hypothetical protein